MYIIFVRMVKKARKNRWFKTGNEGHGEKERNIDAPKHVRRSKQRSAWYSIVS